MKELTGFDYKYKDATQLVNMIEGFNKTNHDKGIVEKFYNLHKTYDISSDTIKVSAIPSSIDPTKVIRELTGGSNKNNFNSDINTDPYYEKYIKYKAKYQTLKNQLKL